MRVLCFEVDDVSLKVRGKGIELDAIGCPIGRGKEVVVF